MSFNLKKRIHLVTGKGGVGKTTVSKTFVQKLEDKQYDVHQFSFNNEGLFSDKENIDFATISQLYLEQKLKSRKLSEFIVRSEIFKSITQVLPNFRYLCIWGYITHRALQKNNSYFILDAPSSGHTLSALQAPQQFMNIFKAGVMYKDCKNIMSALNELLQVHFITLPNQLNYNEMLDFKSHIEKELSYPTSFHMNLSLSKVINNVESSYLKNKYEEELEILEKSSKQLSYIFPFSFENLISTLSKEIKL